ncbi:MAG: hypothetical protein Q8J63_07940 [Candidatus Aquicultor sp.]|nr:hypothetical protein [Candidatus Aquicultor sp.]
MRKEYDFTEAEKNPYAGKLKRQVTIRMDHIAVDCFKKLAEETGRAKSKRNGL